MGRAAGPAAGQGRRWGGRQQVSIVVVGVGGAGCRVLSRLPELMPELSGDGGGDGASSVGDGASSAGDGAWAEEGGGAWAEGGGGGDVTTLACSSGPEALASSGAQRRLLLPPSAETSISSPQIELELRRDLEAELGGSDLVFISAALGEVSSGDALDGCELGTGAAAVAAAAAGRAAGALVVAVVTEPFGFEGGDCSEIAQAALAELQAIGHSE